MMEFIILSREEIVLTNTIQDDGPYWRSLEDMI
jgi:hypothetical protein